MNLIKICFNCKSMNIRILLSFLIASTTLGFAQTGPGGVGTNTGTSSLKIWNRTDNGVSTTGALVDSISNSAGITTLTVSETGALRPTLVAGVVNGYNEISFSGSNCLRTGLNLTTTNFVNDQASTFLVCRADNTTQTSCVYTTDPLVGSTRFTCHVPWSGTVYYDIGVCCGNDARLDVGGLTHLNNYSYWSYDANPTSGKQLYRNGSLLLNRANTTVYSSHATQRFNLGGNTSGTNGFVGDLTEMILFTTKINTAQRIIIENYLAAKYDIASATNDLYTMDNPANGNYDHDVAGIGRVDASNLHDDSQGTGIVRILNPSSLTDNKFLLWGHNNGVAQAIELTDVPSPVQARFNRVWRASEVDLSNTAVDVGSIDVRFNLTGLGTIVTSDLRLLVDTDNDGVFSDETPISGASSLGGNVYQFSAVTAIANGLRFTIGTINTTQTPLPIELLYFNASNVNNSYVQLDWKTASELNNDYFTIERSKDGFDWMDVRTIKGAGNSSAILSYQLQDKAPFNGTSYYKLKQTDFDGHYSYSDIKSVDFNATATNPLVIYPNPTSREITVNAEEFELNNLSVYTILGQNVIANITIKKVSKTELIIDLSQLKQGIYFIRTPNYSSIVTKQ